MTQFYVEGERECEASGRVEGKSPLMKERKKSKSFFSVEITSKRTCIYMERGRDCAGRACPFREQSNKGNIRKCFVS